MNRELALRLQSVRQDAARALSLSSLQSPLSTAFSPSNTATPAQATSVSALTAVADSLTSIGSSNGSAGALSHAPRRRSVDGGGYGPALRRIVAAVALGRSLSDAIKWEITLHEVDDQLRRFLYELGVADSFIPYPMPHIRAVPLFDLFIVAGPSHSLVLDTLRQNWRTLCGQPASSSSAATLTKGASSASFNANAGGAGAVPLPSPVTAEPLAFAEPDVLFQYPRGASLPTDGIAEFCFPAGAAIRLLDLAETAAMCGMMRAHDPPSSQSMQQQASSEASIPFPWPPEFFDALFGKRGLSRGPRSHMFLLTGSDSDNDDKSYTRSLPGAALHAAAGRPVESRTRYCLCLAVTEPITRSMLASAAAGTRHPHAASPSSSTASGSEPRKQSPQSHASTSVDRWSTPHRKVDADAIAVLVPRVFCLVSRYPFFPLQFDALRACVAAWRNCTALRLKAALDAGDLALTQPMVPWPEPAPAAASSHVGANGIGFSHGGSGTPLKSAGSSASILPSLYPRRGDAAKGVAAAVGATSTGAGTSTTNPVSIAVPANGANLPAVSTATAGVNSMSSTPSSTPVATNGPGMISASPVPVPAATASTALTTSSGATAAGTSSTGSGIWTGFRSWGAQKPAAPTATPSKGSKQAAASTSAESIASSAATIMPNPIGSAVTSGAASTPASTSSADATGSSASSATTDAEALSMATPVGGAGSETGPAIMPQSNLQLHSTPSAQSGALRALMHMFGTDPAPPQQQHHSHLHVPGSAAELAAKQAQQVVSGTPMVTAATTAAAAPPSAAQMPASFGMTLPSFMQSHTTTTAGSAVTAAEARQHVHTRSASFTGIDSIVSVSDYSASSTSANGPLTAISGISSGVSSVGVSDSSGVTTLDAFVSGSVAPTGGKSNKLDPLLTDDLCASACDILSRNIAPTPMVDVLRALFQATVPMQGQTLKIHLPVPSSSPAGNTAGAVVATTSDEDAASLVNTGTEKPPMLAFTRAQSVQAVYGADAPPAAAGVAAAFPASRPRSDKQVRLETAVAAALDRCCDPIDSHPSRRSAHVNGIGSMRGADGKQLTSIPPSWQLGCDLDDPEAQSALCDWAAAILFSLLPVDSVLLLVGAALTEQKLIFVGGNLSQETVSACVLAMAAILRPLSWVGPFLPTLPSNLLDVVSAPIPIIVGLPQLPPHFEQDEATVVVLLDRETVRIPALRKALGMSAFSSSSSDHDGGVAGASTAAKAGIGSSEENEDEEGHLLPGFLELQLPGNSSLFHKLEPLSRILRTVPQPQPPRETASAPSAAAAASSERRRSESGAADMSAPPAELQLARQSSSDSTSALMSTTESLRSSGRLVYPRPCYKPNRQQLDASTSLVRGINEHIKGLISEAFAAGLAPHIDRELQTAAASGRPMHLRHLPAPSRCAHALMMSVPEVEEPFWTRFLASQMLACFHDACIHRLWVRDSVTDPDEGMVDATSAAVAAVAATPPQAPISASAKGKPSTAHGASFASAHVRMASSAPVTASATGLPATRASTTSSVRGAPSGAAPKPRQDSAFTLQDITEGVAEGEEADAVAYVSGASDSKEQGHDEVPGDGDCARSRHRGDRDSKEADDELDHDHQQRSGHNGDSHDEYFIPQASSLATAGADGATEQMPAMARPRAGTVGRPGRTISIKSVTLGPAEFADALAAAVDEDEENSRDWVAEDQHHINSVDLRHGHQLHHGPASPIAGSPGLGSGTTFSPGSASAQMSPGYLRSLHQHKRWQKFAHTMHSTNTGPRMVKAHHVHQAHHASNSSGSNGRLSPLSSPVVTSQLLSPVEAQPPAQQVQSVSAASTAGPSN